MTQSSAFLIAAGLSALWCAVHLFVGEREIARPLRQDRTLTPVARETAFLCWHMVSIALALLAGFFLLGVWVSPHYGGAGALLAAGFAAVGLALPKAIAAPYARLPQGFLFVPVAALGLWGLWA